MSVLLAEIFEANPQTLQQFGRNNERQRQRRQRVRQGQDIKVWLTLISSRPNQAADKRQNGEQRVRKVKQTEDYCYQHDALEPLSERQLGATIYETVENVLLKQGPQRQQQKAVAPGRQGDRVARQPADRNYQRYHNRGRQ